MKLSLLQPSLGNQTQPPIPRELPSACASARMQRSGGECVQTMGAQMGIPLMALSQMPATLDASSSLRTCLLRQSRKLHTYFSSPGGAGPKVLHIFNGSHSCVIQLVDPEDLATATIHVWQCVLTFFVQYLHPFCQKFSASGLRDWVCLCQNSTEEGQVWPELWEHSGSPLD